MIGGSSSSSAAFVFPLGAVSSRLKVFQFAELSQGNRAAVVGGTSSEVTALEKVFWSLLGECAVVVRVLERLQK